MARSRKPWGIAVLGRRGELLGIDPTCAEVGVGRFLRECGELLLEARGRLRHDGGYD